MDFTRARLVARPAKCWVTRPSTCAVCRRLGSSAVSNIFPASARAKLIHTKQMPMVSLSHDDLMAQDLAPYIELFQRKDDRVRCVMVSHGGFPKHRHHQGRDRRFARAGVAEP